MDTKKKAGDAVSALQKLGEFFTNMDFQGIDQRAMMKILRRESVRLVKQMDPGCKVRTKAVGVVDGNYLIDMVYTPSEILKGKTNVVLEVE